MSGIISGLKLKQSKKGNRFCVFTLEDFTGHGECIVFPQTYERYKDILHNEAIVSVSGRAEENGNSIKVIVDGIRAIESGPGKDAGTGNGEVTKNGIIIRVDSNKFNPEVLNELKDVLSQSLTEEPWNKNIYFDIYKSDTESKRIKVENVKFNNTVKIAISKIFGEENITEN
jgi:DNA polymerase-3 subunit alpha